jgi:hypothetical protein
MMMGFGFWIMLAVLSVPILLLLSLILLVVRPWVIRTGALPESGFLGAAAGSSRSACSHCGASLQAEWRHCPQCGAPANK